MKTLRQTAAAQDRRGKTTRDGGVQQPSGEASEVPLGADVGARPQQHVQPQLLHEGEERLHIALPLKVKHPRHRLVEVPWHVRLQAVAGCQSCPR